MTMTILRAGLIVGAFGFLWVTWWSMRAGYPIEIAGVRGMLAFMALSFVAYMGELVVATAPPAPSKAAQAEAAAAADTNRTDGAEETARELADATRLAVIAPTLTEMDNDELRAA